MIEKFDRFTKNITVIYQGIQQLKRYNMKNFGLKGHHAMCLFHLMRHSDGLTAAQLCELIGADKSGISRTLSELLKSEYITYPNFNGSKKYKTAAVLTEKGRNITERINQIICKLVAEINSGINENDIAAMYRSLDIISCNIINKSKELQ